MGRELLFSPGRSQRGYACPGRLSCVADTTSPDGNVTVMSEQSWGSEEQSMR